MSPTTWSSTEPSVEAARQRFERPLEALANAETPAIILRNAFPIEECQSLVQRLIDQELLYDPRQPIPTKFQEQTIPEGYYREGINKAASFAWEEDKKSDTAVILDTVRDQVANAQSANGQSVNEKARIDIGSSLGYRGSDQEAFLSHSAETNQLFDELFANQANPIEILYQALTDLSIDKKAVTAYEPDGRKYGSAIIRAHYGGYTYKPHFDSVRLREKRSNYACHAFEHQFAGVLVLQNTKLGDTTAQCRIHHCLWTEEIDPHLRGQGTFHEYAAANEIQHVEVVLEPGDLYFFNTRCIHEVPGVAGDDPRIVLATFVGYDSHREEIFVWS